MARDATTQAEAEYQRDIAREESAMDDQDREDYEAQKGFRAACLGPDPLPGLTRLDWLSSLIRDYEDNLPGVDPEAERSAISHARALLAGLRAAMDRPKGGLP